MISANKNFKDAIISKVKRERVKNGSHVLVYLFVFFEELYRKGTWYGDCFVVNRAGVQTFATEVYDRQERV